MVATGVTPWKAVQKEFPSPGRGDTKTAYLKVRGCPQHSPLSTDPVVSFVTVETLHPIPALFKRSAHSRLLKSLSTAFRLAIDIRFETWLVLSCHTMTATYSIPKTISARFRFRSKPVNARAIKAVIPTYKDWDGLRTTLDSLLRLKTPPKKIIVANDNPKPELPDWLSQYPVQVADYLGNHGPAVARNRGFGLRYEIPGGKAVGALSGIMEGRRTVPSYVRNGYSSELIYPDFATNPDKFIWNSDIDWCYFTDCGCTHDPDIFLEFEKSWKSYGDCCVAISGPVAGEGAGPINDYMTEQGVLNPPLERTLHGVYLPQAIITANALIASLPFAFLGGFDPLFQEAAGEDLDLGIRLRELGVIAWSPKAKVTHRFEEDEADFYKRFRRYGRGNRMLEIKHGLPCLRHSHIKPEKKAHQHLATLALEAMQAGYDEAIDLTARGVLKILPDE
jgi:GT2 family glycosyltransferase